MAEAGHTVTRLFLWANSLVMRQKCSTCPPAGNLPARCPRKQNVVSSSLAVTVRTGMAVLWLKATSGINLNCCKLMCVSQNNIFYTFFFKEKPFMGLKWLGCNSCSWSIWGAKADQIWQTKLQDRLIMHTRDARLEHEEELQGNCTLGDWITWHSGLPRVWNTSTL